MSTPAARTPSDALEAGGTARLAVEDASDWAGAQWDALVDRAVNGTLFHRREFLDYHGDRFAGRARYLVLRRRGRPVAQIPISLQDDPDGVLQASSPFGASLGGFVFQKQPTLAVARACWQALRDWLVDAGARRLRLTPVPSAFALEPSDLPLFALLEAGLQSVSRDVSNVLTFRPGVPVVEQVSTRARRAARKALQSGVQVRGDAPLADFWPVLRATFAGKDVPPTHTREELDWLCRALPGRVTPWVAYRDREPIAGVCRFRLGPHLDQAFYICQDPEHRALQGLTALMLDLLEDSHRDGVAMFDFGTSSFGMQARDNVFEFKENFARACVFRETLEWHR